MSVPSAPYHTSCTLLANVNGMNAVAADITTGIFANQHLPFNKIEYFYNAQNLSIRLNPTLGKNSY